MMMMMLMMISPTLRPSVPRAHFVLHGEWSFHPLAQPSRQTLVPYSLPDHCLRPPHSRRRPERGADADVITTRPSCLSATEEDGRRSQGELWVVLSQPNRWAWVPGGRSTCVDMQQPGQSKSARANQPPLPLPLFHALLPGPSTTATGPARRRR